MPATSVRVTGLEDALATLAAIPGAVAGALAKAGAILSEEGTTYWRSLVTKRTGRMSRGLNVRVVARGAGVFVYYYVGRGAFYYRFQAQADAWDTALAAYLGRRAPAVIGAEISRAIASI